MPAAIRPGEYLFDNQAPAAERIDGHLDAMDRDLHLALGPLISAWGRRPPQA